MTGLIGASTNILAVSLFDYRKAASDAPSTEVNSLQEHSEPMPDTHFRSTGDSDPFSISDPSINISPSITIL
jgi:hypothetical protein